MNKNRKKIRQPVESKAFSPLFLSFFFFFSLPFSVSFSFLPPPRTLSRSLSFPTLSRSRSWSLSHSGSHSRSHCGSHSRSRSCSHSGSHSRRCCCCWSWLFFQLTVTPELALTFALAPSSDFHSSYQGYSTLNLALYLLK